MKLTFKDLKQRKIEVEVEPSETIQAVKVKLREKEGWEPSTQKLIYSGKILQDEKTVESYGIDEKGWVVCMISKPKAAPKPAAEPSTPAKPASTPAAPAAPAASTTSGSAAAVPSTPTPSAPSTTAADPVSFNDPSALAMGEQRAAAIASMEGMGFPRDQIDRAMRAAFFNPDRAVEYLLNGIPETVQQEERPAVTSPRGGAAAPAPQQPATGGNTGSTPAAPTTTNTGSDEGVNLFEAAAQRGAGGGTGGNGGAAAPGAGGQGGGAAAASSALDFLRNVPQFQQLRQVVQQQPQMLEPILQQVAAGNPQLAHIINQHPEQFMQLLAEDGDEDVALPPGVQQISVTEEEREAIERLCRLGFERDDVIQAYFACDKNEELAANFLFEQPDDGDEPGNNNN